MVAQTDICFWEQGTWPLVKGDEQLHKNFEDLRRRIWLIRNLTAGAIDLERKYGWEVAGNPPTYRPFDDGMWKDYWINLAPFNPIRPGNKIVLFKDNTGHVDLYINMNELTHYIMPDHPPVIADQLDSYWLLYPNPNKYHHYDRNAGRPSIKAEGRWFVFDHPEPNFDADCYGAYKGYVCWEKVFEWYPRQLDPLVQLAPLKIGGTIKRRLGVDTRKVEIKKNHITQEPKTHWDRTIDQKGYKHQCTKARRMNEYVLEAGEPKDWLSDPAIGQDYSDPLINEAYQDQVIHACEFQERFVKKVDDEWIKNFVHYHVKNTWWTEWPDPYDVGDIVWVSQYDPDYKYEMSSYYVCIQYHDPTPEDPKMPGTPAGEGYWLTPAYQPQYFLGHWEYAYLRDIGDQFGVLIEGVKLSSGEFWDCNGSAYELLLREIDSDNPHYDWYWDTEHPYVPDWMYKAQYAVPGGDLISYPSPRGCWRRIWKHTMGRPKHSVTGEAFLMWPGELGYPPGYWEGRGGNGWGEKDGNLMKHRFVVTQADYDAIPGGSIVWYRVVDVEGLYAAAYKANKIRIDELLKKTHDPVLVQSRKYKDADGNEIIKLFPFYEIHHELVNDMRAVLLQLKTIKLSRGSSYSYGWGGIMGTPCYDSSLDAYKAGKRIAEVNYDPDNIPSTGMWVGYLGVVGYIVDEGKWYPGSDMTPQLQIHKDRIILESSTEPPFNPNAGFELVRLGYGWPFNSPLYPEEVYEGCTIGVGEHTIRATAEIGYYDWRYGWVGLEIQSSGWVWDDYSSKWDYKTVLRVWPADHWPPEEYFDGLVPADGWRAWWRCTQVSGPSGLYEFWGFEIDYDKFPQSVFELDETNFVEVT